MENIHGEEDRPPHVAIIPSSGMGHLTPSLRLAATLAAQGCIVSVVSVHPTVSSSESLQISRFFSQSTHIRPLPFRPLPLHHPSSSSADPFFLQFEAIRRSAHLLPPLLTSASPPLSALITDVTLASAVASLSLPCPNYICFTSSAAMLSFLAVFSAAAAGKADLDVPGFASPFPTSFIPPLLHNPTHLFTTQFVENGRALVKAHGILVNTFHALEPEPLAALNGGRVVQGLPSVTAVGPLEPLEFERGRTKLSWLDDQPAASVAYVSFGSRTALSRDQIKHLAIGLEKSRCRFLWVLKSKFVDKEDLAVELSELVGLEFLERIKDKGLVVKDWVDQWEVLGHAAIGGFISHCGWNSITEAVLRGVPVLAWPQGGDQKVNAEIVARSGLGIWVEEWGWGGEALVTGEEISRHVQALMNDVSLRARAAHIGEKARQAISTNGSSVKALAGLINSWRHKSVDAEAAV